MDDTTNNQVNGPALPVPADAGLPQAIQAPQIAQVPGLDPGATNTPVPAAPSSDEDDVIDKAWIAKVKQIVLATSGDPYKQSQQLAALKTEYLQKRYHKTITPSA